MEGNTAVTLEKDGNDGGVLLSKDSPSDQEETGELLPERFWILQEEDALFRDTSARRHEATIYENILFFLCGLGSSMCYIATLSSLVYFMMEYGANSFVYLNLAIYLPLVPVSLAQARWDQEYDKRLGSYRTFTTRGTVGFVSSILGTLLIPMVSGFGMLIVSAICQGIGGAVLLGTFNQMASFVETTGRLKASVSAGAQASALVVLIISLLTGFGSSGSGQTLQPFFFIVVGYFAIRRARRNRQACVSL
jgi:hypothetical protein